MTATVYDRVSAALIVGVLATVVLLVWVGSLWLANRNVSSIPELRAEVVVLEGQGDRDVDETLRIESPDEPVDNPSTALIPVVSDDTDETVRTVIVSAGRVTAPAPGQVENTDKKGRRDGSSVGALGETGVPGPGARWFIRFDDRGALDEYARQFDHFGIELGLFKSGRIEVLSGLSEPKARRQTHTSGAKLKHRHYFTWAGGKRKQADIELLKQKAGLETDAGIIFHFYPDKTIELLLKLERNAAERPIREISRTYFAVRRKGRGFEFFVSRIRYK